MPIGRTNKRDRKAAQENGNLDFTLSEWPPKINVKSG
jgi:hypothetical protein